MGDEEEQCPQMDSCAMYDIFHHTGTLGAWKALYCMRDFPGCARYERIRNGQPVPVNLMPNGTLLKTSKAGGGPKK